MFDDAEVIVAYPLEQALYDGTLVPIFVADWYRLTGGKPVVATQGIVTDIPVSELKQLWNKFAKIRNLLAETHEYHHYSDTYNGQAVWIIEDERAVTYMYPHEY